MKKQTVDYQQEFYKAKIERAARRRKGWAEFCTTIAQVLAGFALAALAAAIIIGAVGGIMYGHERQTLYDRISTLERSQNSSRPAWYWNGDTITVTNFSGTFQ